MPFGSTKTNLATPFNNTVTKLSDEQRAQATQGGQLTELIQSLYSILLYDTEADATVAAGGLDPGNRTSNAEYFFRVPPKVHEFDEPFATTIQGTQNGGKFVESYGSIIKSIRISGTTGLRPNKIASPTIPLLGISDQQLSIALGSGLSNSVRRISPDERTGHDDIIFLRNIFRHYSDLKSFDDIPCKTVMLWRNIKDADYWVVEPEDFRLSQSSGSPLLYEYSINFKTLSRFDFSYAAPFDPLEEARSKQRMLSRLQEYGQNLTNIFMTVSTQINRLQGYASFISSTILAPVVNIVNGLNAVKTSAYGVVKGLRNQALTLQDNLVDAIDKLITVTPIQDPVVRALRRTQITVARILSEPVAAESAVKDVSALISRYAAAYETPGTTTTARRAPQASSSYIGYQTIPDAVGSSLIGLEEDIRDLAERLLGDRTLWRILAALNRLSSPFISVTGGPGVLMPGDSILFPKSGANVRGTSTSSQNPTSNETSQGLNTPVQQAYGRDLLLKSSFENDDEITDIVLNQSGDLASIQGIPNVQQAFRIKFMTERGELAAHPKFGAKFAIGRKATPSSFNELRINTLNTIISDTRVDDVNSLKFLASGDTLAIAADIKLVNASDIVSTTFALRRF